MTCGPRSPRATISAIGRPTSATWNASCTAVSAGSNRGKCRGQRAGITIRYITAHIAIP
ncbi:MAG: hypothetical protein ACTHU0_14045 [Kofleriaceae bacterium]